MGGDPKYSFAQERGAWYIYYMRHLRPITGRALEKNKGPPALFSHFRRLGQVDAPEGASSSQPVNRRRVGWENFPRLMVGKRKMNNAEAHRG